MQKFTLLFVLGIALSCVYAFPGGLSDEKQATEITQSCVESTSKDIKAKAALALGLESGDVFGNEIPRAFSYKTQTVAGTFYYIKTGLGGRIFHVKLLVDLQGKRSVSAVKLVRDLNEPIVYFD